MIRNPNSKFAHPDNVHDMLIVFLNFDRRKNQRALGINILRRTHIGRGQGIAAIRLMRFGEDCKTMDALIVDYRNKDRMIRRMGTAVIG